jgi:N-methylhydantoinase B
MSAAQYDAAPFDAVSLGILWDRLVSISDEIVETLVRTSFSTIVRESYDLSVMLFDQNGLMFAQGTRSIPVFIGTAAVTLRHMLQRFPPETLVPGDVVVTNDPIIGTGHLFDINVMRPVYRQDRLVGYTMSITHLPDIGGMGFSAAATEMLHEGLRLPICKLVKAGQIDPFIVELIRANVRVPEQVIGDIMANISCNEVGAQQLLEFMAEYDLDDLAICAQSERAMRDRLKTIPDGVYAHRVNLEGIHTDLQLTCSIDKRGDGISIDFTGSSGAVKGGINVPFCYTRAMALYAVKCLTASTIPNNAGSAAPIQVTAPLGCLLNAQPPSATAGRHVVGHFVAPLIYGALAASMPDRVQADTGMINILTFHGRHPDGTPISTLYFAAGGFGALQELDGISTLPGPSNMACVPVEVWELQTGITVESKRLRVDSGGAGRWRGGLGQEIVMRNDTMHDLTVFSMANRTEFAAAGLRGGLAGGLREHRINGSAAPPKGRAVLAPGDRLTLLEAGGGGMGDPRARVRGAVVADVQAGFISAEAALSIYGLEAEETAQNSVAGR